MLEKIKELLKNDILSAREAFGELTLIVAREKIVEVATFLKDEPAFAFNMLTDLTAVDALGLKRDDRYEVVYQLYSVSRKHSIRLKVTLSEDDPIVPSVTDLWAVANWLEREVWDMYGIRFDGHPDLRRMLMYEEFKGHPLRKDYVVNKRQPLIGPKN